MRQYNVDEVLAICLLRGLIMTEKQQETAKETPWFGIGIIVTCCLIPLLPLFFAISSGWIETLTSMQTLRVLFLILALLFFCLGYRKLYLLPKRKNHE